MNKSDKERLALLKKANRLGMLLPRYLNRLSEIEPEFERAGILDAIRIDKMRIELNASNRETILIKRSPKSKPSTIHDILKLLKNELGKVNYFSIDKLMELWFAELNTSFLIDNFEKVIDIDEDLFIVHDKELKNGLWLDLNEEYWTTENVTNYEFIYELKIWGSTWTNLLVNLK